MAHVAGDEGERFLKGGGGNEQIHVGNELALLTKSGAQAGKALDDPIGQRQDGEIAEEVAQAGEGRWRSRGAEGAFVDLGDGDDADGQALITQAVQHALRAWPANGGIDQPIGVDQVSHGRVIGRVPPSRLR